MQFKKKLTALCISLTLLLAGCTNLSLPTNADAAFENYTLTLFKEDVASSTLGLHYTLLNPEAYGIENYPITLGSFTSDQGESLASLENCQAVLDKFSYNALSEKNQLTYDVLSSYLNTAMEGAAFSLYEEPLSPVTGIHAQLPVLLAEYTFASMEDVQTYLALLKTLPDYFSSLIEFEKEKSAAGLFMSSSSAEEVLAQCNAFLSMGDSNYLISTFEERLGTLSELSKDGRADLCSQNRKVLSESVLPAYESLTAVIASLKDTSKNEMGICYLPQGKDFYQYLVARETGSTRSIDEILALIQNQMAEDLLDMQDILNEYGTAAASISTISSETPDTILKSLRTKSADAFPVSKEVNVEIKYVPSALEPYLSPAFYLIPAIDNTGENTIYINQAHNLENIHLFTTLAHEGYPGHLYQTTYFAAQNPDPLRSLFNFKGYVEGWATYAEMTSYYLSSLEKPAATLLQKNNSFILGLYAHADIGIHYAGWNLDRTITFFSTYGIDDRDTIADIYALIVGDPANYLSYYVGYLEILELKKEVIAQKGQDFSQKEFHQSVLDVGPAPFDVVRKYVLEK